MASISHWFLGMIPALSAELIHSEHLLSTLKHIPSDVDIWGALCRPFDMGEEYSSYFSTFLGIPCRLAYVNVEVPRYIQGPLPPLYCQQGAHPRTGLSDGAPYLYVKLHSSC